MEFVKGFSSQIDDHYTIKIATDNRDEFLKILELNVAVHGEPVRNFLSRIFLEHPRRDQFLWFYIEDNYSKKAVSSISLLPLEWSIANIPLPVSEMEFVGTLEKYRGMGFIGELNKLYELAMAERGYILSVIKGIPFYYRKLGYEFAIPLDDRMLLSAKNVPSTELNHLQIRKADFNDRDFVKKMYQEYYQSFFISNNFDIDSHAFRYFNDEFNEFKSMSFMIEDNGKPSSYFTFGMSYDNLAYDIKTSLLNEEECIKLLQFIKEISGSENNDEINLCAREDTVLGKKILELGGIHHHTYGWQVKIPNLKLYFKKIKTILETRINNSLFSGLTQNIKISNYRETFELCFENGQISTINLEKGYPGEGLCDLQMPDHILYKLILGDRNFNEINHIIKDAMVKHNSKDLINILFPKENLFPDS